MSLYAHILSSAILMPVIRLGSSQLFKILLISVASIHILNIPLKTCVPGLLSPDDS